MGLAGHKKDTSQSTVFPALANEVRHQWEKQVQVKECNQLKKIIKIKIRKHFQLNKNEGNHYRSLQNYQFQRH